MTDPDELQEWIDGYVDGSLDKKQLQRLLERVQRDPEAKRRLAEIAVTDRLLRARAAGPVSARGIMGKLRRDTAPDRDTGSSVGWPLPLGILVALGIGGYAVFHFSGEGSKRGTGPVSNLVTPPVPIHPPNPGTPGPDPGPVPAIPEPAPAEPAPPAVSLYQAFPLDPPEPEIPLVAPAGDGSKEEGFVPPPPGWERVESRGRAQETGKPEPPLLWVKLRHGEERHWKVMPNDLVFLLDALEAELGLGYGSETRSVEEIDPYSSASPVIYFSTHYHFQFSPDQRALLRRYLLKGGMIVFNPGLGSKPAYDSARRELRRIFPELPIEWLHADHPIYHAYFELADLKLEGITLSCRTAAVISPSGLSLGLQEMGGDLEVPPRTYAPETARRIGINLSAYAIGMRGRARPAANTVALAGGEAGLRVAQVMHGGTWRTRYTGLPLLLRSFNQRTEVPVKLEVVALPLSSPELFNHPLLYLTGHEPLRLEQGEVAALRQYLRNGGTLFAESCCGRKGFDQSFRQLMKAMFGAQAILKPVPPDAPLFNTPHTVKQLGVTKALGARRKSMLIAPRLESFELGGQVAVIYSPYGLAGSWEMSQSPYALGYEDPNAMKLGENILMHVITQ